MINKKRFFSLKSKIMVSTVIPIVVSFSIISSVIFTSLFHSFEETAQAELLLIGQKYADSFEQKIDNAMNYLSIATSTLEWQIDNNSAERERMQEIFLNIFDNYKLIDGTSVMFEYNMYDGKDDEYVGTEYGTVHTGKICYYFYMDGGKTAFLPEALENDIEFELPHYTDAKAADKPIYTDPVVHEVDGRSIPMFTITHPIHNKNNVFIGAVTVDLFLEDIYDQLQKEQIYETGYIVITNDKDQVIYSPVFDDISKNREEAGVLYALPAKHETAAYSNSASLINGEDCFITTVPVYISQLDNFFYITVAAPIREIHASGNHLMVILILFCLLVVMGISLLIYYLIGKISKPIKDITESANKIADGNMDETTAFDSAYKNIKTMDEVHILFIALKKMLSQLNEVQQFKLDTLELKLKKEKAEAAALAKDSFLAKMSHEIRTPMNAIMGMIELILRKELSQDVYENALEIKSASSNLLSIINDILDFSKIESGKMEIIETPYLFPSLINDIVSIIRMRLLDRPILFVVNIDSNIPASLTGDEIRIRQILLNLLSNAVKYTNEGAISLTVSGLTKNNSVMLTMEISDSGIGINDEDIGKLFGDFIQLDGLKNKGIEGTGLGLAIARNLCRAMGGDITVHSEYDRGSTFTITLPQRFETYSPFAIVTSPDEKSVLLYETRQIYRDSVVRSLSNLGVACESVQNITSLFGSLERFPYVFVSSYMYGSINPALKKLNKPPKLVLMADISESLFAKDARMLTMPAHTLSIANVLNGVYENFGEPHDVGVSFTAPGARVLIVDDITANLKVAEGLLSPYEMQIDICKSGKEAIKMVAANGYDLVFMDHMMPEMDGIEVTGHIRAMEGEYFENLPIVALTANAVSGVREMFIQNGMDDFLAKPIETVKLNSILDKWIPKAKRFKAREPEQLDKVNDFVQTLKTIPELTIDKALSIVGGSTSTYERIVKLTVRLLPENINELAMLIETDLNGYAIAVHGIKGVLNNIGAYALGETAFELELLSKSGNLDACMALHPDFIRTLTDFSERIVAFMDKTDDADKPFGDKMLLFETLSKLEEAVEFFDSALALEILSPIGESAYEPEVDDMVANMIYSFERFDFDEADELIQKLKGLLSKDK